jgi:hypothetical protein
MLCRVNMDINHGNYKECQANLSFTHYNYYRILLLDYNILYNLMFTKMIIVKRVLIVNY